MEYLSAAIAAKKYGVTTRRMQQMCKSGEIAGAIRDGKRWMIPVAAISGYEKTDDKKMLPIGISDFKKAVTEYYYIDKTLLIRDFIDRKPQVALFTRPRRFGKSLNMDMLRVFFESSSEDTSIYFHDKAIWNCGDYYKEYQGQYPVIYLSFKDVKYTTWENAYLHIRNLIMTEADRHRYLLDSNDCSDLEKRFLSTLLNGDASEVEVVTSLEHLSRMLHMHHGKPCIILIDEYDTPIQQGFVCGYYDKVIEFIRNFFSGGLKDNPHLAHGFLTGILRVAKESIFSGMNNLKVYGITDELFSQYFGFTKEEITKLLDYYECLDKYEEICQWYDGYIFGNTEIFNPWSVINYIDEKCYPKAFWQFTGNNDIIGEIISVSTPSVMENLRKLLQGETVTTYIDTNVIYPEIRKNPSSIYSFLLTTGYLKISTLYPQFDGNYMCEVKIPNKEIMYVYEKEIIARNQFGTNESTAIEIREAICMQDVKRLQELLESYIIHTISYLDTADETFYQCLMIGICAILNNRYYVISNRESGMGRFDIQLEPHTKSLPGFIFELKASKKTNDNLKKIAEDALMQIEEKYYDDEMKCRGISKIIKIGVAFRGKEVAIESK